MENGPNLLVIDDIEFIAECVYNDRIRNWFIRYQYKLQASMTVKPWHVYYSSQQSLPQWARASVRAREQENLIPTQKFL